MRRPSLNRRQEIDRARQRLERDGFPRLQMALLVALTGAAGFIASYALLHAGVQAMWLRTRAEDYVDIQDLPLPSARDTAEPAFGGKGGGFDGGGASADVDHPGDGTSLVGDAAEAVAGADELAIPLGIIVVLGLLLFSSLWVVAGAPLLFAELLVDGVLAASLYRRLRGLDTRHWLDTAIRRTCLPFAVSAALLAGAGWIMQQAVPDARSMGDVVLHLRSR